MAVWPQKMVEALEFLNRCLGPDSEVTIMAVPGIHNGRYRDTEPAQWPVRVPLAIVTIYGHPLLKLLLEFTSFITNILVKTRLISLLTVLVSLPTVLIGQCLLTPATLVMQFL